MVRSIREGLWIARLGPVLAWAMVLGSVLGTAWLMASSHNGLNDANGNPLGADYANVWLAGQGALSGEAARAYDPVAHGQVQNDVFGLQAGFLAWLYPPVFFLIAAPFALLPYLWSWGAYIGAGLLAYGASIGALLPRTLWAGKVSPATFWAGVFGFSCVFINVVNGQNGFITAALFGFGLWALRERREILAGLILAGLIYKPQYGVFLPLVFALGGHWRAFVACGTGAIGLCALSVLAFGPAPWLAFFGQLGFTSDFILGDGPSGHWKFASVYPVLRMMGLAEAHSWIVQAGVFAACAWALVVLWRGRASFELKAAGLVSATLLATPYAYDYDFTALAVPLALLCAHGLREGFTRYEASALALVWFLPSLIRSLQDAWTLPIGPIAPLVLLSITLARAGANALTGPQPERKPA